MKSFVILFAALFLLPISTARAQDTPPYREATYAITYTVTVSDIPGDHDQLDIWIPLPLVAVHQNVNHLEIHSPAPYRVTGEDPFGNRMIHLRMHQAPPSFSAGFTATVTRRENNVYSGREAGKNMIPAGLRANRLVPLSQEAEAIAARVLAERNRHQTGSRYRLLYDHVLDHMVYDKSGEGWGRGDFNRACVVGQGNCTDFHSYFIGLLRNLDIPAFFEIGLPIPENRQQGKVSGYHCWAYFNDGSGWVPVDISEADKHPEKIDYYFGNLDENRIAFTRGRDLVLIPPQRGEPLNYFIDPYVELDGKPFSGVKRRFTFRRVENVIRKNAVHQTKTRGDHNETSH